MTGFKHRSLLAAVAIMVGLGAALPGLAADPAAPSTSAKLDLLTGEVGPVVVTQQANRWSLEGSATRLAALDTAEFASTASGLGGLDAVRQALGYGGDAALAGEARFAGPVIDLDALASAVTAGSAGQATFAAAQGGYAGSLRNVLTGAGKGSFAAQINATDRLIDLAALAEALGGGEQATFAAAEAGYSGSLRESLSEARLGDAAFAAEQSTYAGSLRTALAGAGSADGTFAGGANGTTALYDLADLAEAAGAGE